MAPFSIDFLPEENKETQVLVDDEICLTLRKAADVIRERGHHKGWFCQKRGGAVCFWGAINVARGRGPSHASKKLVKQITLLMGRSAPTEMADWNDAPGRTASEVIAALESAADSRAQSLLAQRGR